MIRVEGGKIVIEPISRDLEEKVEVWVKAALNTSIELFSEEIGESWKLMDEKYARRKLGLLS